ncbi:hypothetical protein J2Y69_001296 [Microbacterium resistens]|uniref:Uncharacterized protein n=1 Tax=Microbacterium resistens TaxID=156977 RepID=A0ABU1SBS0_9MICO|nr:S1 family peptidase [Microbacterium resistens]MDR6866703.1 hypothetical protein [Microbacterium resistens]
MKRTSRRLLTLSAVGASAALAMGGILAVPAMATTVETANAPVDGTGYDEFALGLLKADSAIVSVGQNEQGDVVVTRDKDKEVSAATAATIASYANVHLEQGDEIIALSQDQVVGGAGYINQEESAVCSVGFPAWTSAGAPALLTAGHCGTAGQTAWRSAPVDDDAPNKPTVPGDAQYTPSVLDAAAAGSFDFSIYGGPNNDPAATDIAGITLTNAALHNLPAVTDWTTFASNDLAASATPVTAVGEPVVGQQIQKSGRTTGLTDSTVSQINVWAQVSGNYVFGFASDGAPGTVFGGDSGGSVFAGGTALGVVSGGNTDGSLLFSTNLVNALAQTPGYTVMLDLAEPVVTSPAAGTEVAPGSAITGTGPAGLTLEYTVNGGAPQTVTILADGTWSIPAPAAEGTANFAFTVTDAPGFNRSETVPFSVIVKKAPIAPLVITSPAAGSTVVGPDVTISGTGAPGATIQLLGGVTGTTTVGSDGTWSVTGPAPYGSVEVIVTQTVGDDVKTGNTSFSVAPAAPAITSPADGAQLTVAPSAIAGTGIPGATVTVTLDGTALTPAVTVGQDGTWAVAVPAGLALGGHAISAVQSVDDVASAASTSAFALIEATVPTPQPSTPAGPSSPSNPGGGLPATGADGGALLGTGIVGGALVVIAGSVLLIARMRAKSVAE